MIKYLDEFIESKKSIYLCAKQIKRKINTSHLQRMHVKVMYLIVEKKTTTTNEQNRKTRSFGVSRDLHLYP